MQQPVHNGTSTSPNDALTDSDLMKMLSSMGHAVPFEYIIDADHRGEPFESRLKSVLRDQAAWERDPSDPAHWLPLHAIMILGRMTSESAGIALAEALEMAVLADSALLDYVASCWPALLRNKPDSILPVYERVLRTGADDELGRIISAEVLLAAADARGPDDLEHELRKIAALAADESESLDFRQQMASMLLAMPRSEHREVIESLAGVNRDWGTLYEMFHVEMVFKTMREEPAWERFEDPWEFYSDEAIEDRSELFADDMDGVDDTSAAPKTLVRETPKVGRNDLCPCRSGRKYKKCCLSNDAKSPSTGSG
ncbi:MAG TPA: SEC-C metal-binding domain-containing protein [Steroidobacteraceae bacterium]|nr:SEC-C metal-binding domain-containing protein [Steroidobacteraceae bacterium]